MTSIATPGQTLGRPSSSRTRTARLARHTLRPSGRIVWLDSRAVLVRDDEGRPRFWQGVAIDVTAHRELESRYRDLAEMVFGELGVDAD